MTIDALHRLTIPAIEEMGFRQCAMPPAFGGKAKTQAHPFGQFKRKMENGTDLLALEFDKRGEARFVIIFGTAPAGDLANPFGKPILHKDVWVSWLPKHYALYENAWLLSGFGVRQRLWQAKKSQVAYDKLALRILNILPSIDLALRHDRRGPHVRATW